MGGPPKCGWGEYMRDWRWRHPTEAEGNRMYMRARGRALTALKAMFPDEFEMLMKTEMLEERMEWEAHMSESGVR